MRFMEGIEPLKMFQGLPTHLLCRWRFSVGVYPVCTPAVEVFRLFLY